MAGRRNPKNNKNANARSKRSRCTNWKRKTPWPEARTQAKTQRHEKNPTRLDTPKNTTNKKENTMAGQENLGKQKERDCAPKSCPTNAKHHGTQHHFPKNKYKKGARRSAPPDPQLGNRKLTLSVTCKGVNGKRGGARFHSTVIVHWHHEAIYA